MIRHVQLFPNPTSGDLMITVSEQQSIQQIHVYNSSGTKVMTATPNHLVDMVQQQINLSSLGAGVYLLDIIINGHHYLENVIVK